ncbi:T9SS type A sorting domain-containing protein [Empedobacter falsenii]
MKKNLLALFVLGAIYSASAQDTYIGDKAVVKVNSNTLFYNGGNVTLNATNIPVVSNEGNVFINGGTFSKGSSGNQTGVEFVNKWTSSSQYGQLIIKNSSNANVTAKVTVEKQAANTNNYVTYPIGMPFQDNVKQIMTAFNNGTFKVECGFEQYSCGNELYTGVTLKTWNNDKIVNDVVTADKNFVPGSYYLLNLRDGVGIKEFMTGIINYKGTPAPQQLTLKGNSVIHNMSQSDFSTKKYSEWKGLFNKYREPYYTYLGDNLTDNMLSGKNVYRFANPYTSNIDLSNIDSWLTLLNGNNGSSSTVTSANLLPSIKSFNITKRMDSFTIGWDPQNGSTSSANGYYLAKLDVNNNWTGSPEALIIKPLETFNLNFPMLDPSKLGGTRIINVQANFTDNLKTFSNTPSVTVLPKSGAKSSNLSQNDFVQMELYMTNDNMVIGDPVYLVGTTYYSTGGASKSVSNNSIYLFDEKVEGGVNLESQSNFNDFNTNDYIGKPLGIGFNNLTEGNSYTFRLNLFEESIFNKVEKLANGKFYLLDKKKDEVKEIDSNSIISFTADNNNNERFEIYWNESPKTLATNENNLNKSTLIYKENSNHKIRFEFNNTTANIEIYDLAGRKVQENKNLTTNTDYTLNLPSKAIYVVKITYNNGKVISTKVVNN